jgi:hypothetical protein
MSIVAKELEFTKDEVGRGSYYSYTRLLERDG